jgi:hypothetical protein
MYHNNNISECKQNKSILIYHLSFTVQRCSATCFDIQEFIIRRIYKNSILILELYFNMDLHFYYLFYF